MSANLEKVASFQDIKNLVYELHRIGLVRQANRDERRRTVNAIYDWLDGRPLDLRYLYIDEMAKEFGRAKITSTGIDRVLDMMEFGGPCRTPELVTYLKAWMRILRESPESKAAATPPEPIPCTALCNPGSKSKCPNFLFGRKTAAMDNNKSTIACYEVERMLREMDVNPEECSRCILGAIMSSSIKLTKKMIKNKDLDKIVYVGRGYCECDVPVNLRDVIYQSDFGGWDHGAPDWAPGRPKVQCDSCQSQRRYFLSGLCGFKVLSKSYGMLINDGKYHHHCNKCAGYGVCYMDYRERHCPECGEHSMGDISCSTRGCVRYTYNF